MKLPMLFSRQVDSWSWRSHLARPYAGSPLHQLIAGWILLNVVLGSLAFSTRVVVAQSETPQFRITGIDTEKFPDVQVTVYGENLDTDLAEAPITLQEDNIPVTAQNSTVALGSQTLLVIDTYAGIKNPGMTGAPRIDEVTNAISQLTNGQYLLPDKDWLAFVSFDNSSEQAKSQIFAPWNQSDHQKVINSVLEYASSQIDNAKTNTPLFDLLFTSIHYFDDTRPPQNLARSIVVFSNGVDTMAFAEKEDLKRLANERHVRIFTVQFGAIDNDGAQQVLQNLALNTGGRYFHLEQDNALLDDLWETIQASQQQQLLTYRSANANPAQITASTKTSTLDLSDTMAFPNIDVRPPQLIIVQPKNAIIDKELPGGEALQYNTPVSELEPKELQVEIQISWPDGFPRDMQRVEYSIGEKTVEVTVEPFDSYTFPIDTLDQGEYTIHVSAVDELGLTGIAAAMPLSIIVDRPAAPDFGGTATADANQARAAAATATAEMSATAAVMAVTAVAEQTVEAVNAAATRTAFESAQATAQAEAARLHTDVETLGGQNTTLRYLTYGGYATGVIALLLALFVWLNPRTRKRATEFVSGTVGRFTEFWSPDGGQHAPVRQLRARLVPVNSGDGLQPLDLFSGSARIGRDPALATVVINDPRVSRYHCRISEEGNGSFKIWDEGSTSGTYVNSEAITMAGRTLQSGDLINFGPIQYRFEPVLAAAQFATTPPRSASTDATQPFIMNSQDSPLPKPANDPRYTNPTVGSASNPLRTEAPTTPYQGIQTQGTQRAGENPANKSSRDSDAYTRPLRNSSDDATQIGPIDDATRG